MHYNLLDKVIQHCKSYDNLFCYKSVSHTRFRHVLQSQNKLIKTIRTQKIDNTKIETKNRRWQYVKHFMRIPSKKFFVHSDKFTRQWQVHFTFVSIFKLFIYFRLTCFLLVSVHWKISLISVSSQVDFKFIHVKYSIREVIVFVCSNSFMCN